MTAAMTKEITEQEVIAYLQSRKDFFSEHPEILEQMVLPGVQAGRGVVDFQSALVERLKADKSSAQKIQRELIDTVRANMSNYNRIQTAILVLLEAESFEEFINVLTQDFPVFTQLEAFAFGLETLLTAIASTAPQGAQG